MQLKIGTITNTLQLYDNGFATKKEHDKSDTSQSLPFESR